MRCKACNVMVDSPVVDSVTGVDSGLCHDCYRVSEEVRTEEYIERTEYAHNGGLGHGPDS